jgi:hypothetical protein
VHEACRLSGSARRDLFYCLDCLECFLFSTGSVLNIEPLGSMICWRSKPEIAERSQVLTPQMIDPSGSRVSASTGCSYSIPSLWCDQLSHGSCLQPPCWLERESGYVDAGSPRSRPRHCQLEIRRQWLKGHRIVPCSVAPRGRHSCSWELQPWHRHL